MGGLQLQVIVEPQEFERLQKLKEWDFVDTFTDAEVARWVPHCHANSSWSHGHPSKACCSWTLLSARPPGALLTARVHKISQDLHLLALYQTPGGAAACRLHMYIDFVVCLGGDGVLLHASYLFKRAIPPVTEAALFGPNGVLPWPRPSVAS